VGRVFKGFGPENFGRKNRWFVQARQGVVLRMILPERVGDLRGQP